MTSEQQRWQGLGWALSSSGSSSSSRLSSQCWQCCCCLLPAACYGIYLYPQITLCDMGSLALRLLCVASRQTAESCICAGCCGLRCRQRARCVAGSEGCEKHVTSTALYGCITLPTACNAIACLHTHTHIIQHEVHASSPAATCSDWHTLTICAALVLCCCALLQLGSHGQCLTILR